MSYTFNGVYTAVVNAIKAGFPDAYATSRYVGKPSSFPAVYIHEIDRSRPLRFTQLDFEDSQWESNIEIQVVSDKAVIASTEAHDIIDLARAALSTLYYREVSLIPIDAGDKFTLIGRYRRVIGGGDTMPKT